MNEIARLHHGEIRHASKNFKIPKTRRTYILFQILIYVTLFSVTYFFRTPRGFPTNTGHRKLFFEPGACESVKFEEVEIDCGPLWEDRSSCDDAKAYYRCLQEGAFACHAMYSSSCISNLTTICNQVPECYCKTPQTYPKGVFFSQPYCKNAWLSSTKKAAIILHIIGILYMFVGLSVVCDDYFCGALEIMVDHWNIKPDVAGATFMAAGGSAPELFTSLLGVFFSESDVGFGTIVGSAVFNVLFVIGLCAALALSVLQLTWWPLFRDCSYYLISLSVLTAFASDKVVHWYEAAILFLMYLNYVTMMRWNSQLEQFFTKLFTKIKPQRISPKYDGEERQKKGLNGEMEKLSSKQFVQNIKRDIHRDMTKGILSTQKVKETVERKRKPKENLNTFKAAANLLILQQHHGKIVKPGAKKEEGKGGKSSATVLPFNSGNLPSPPMRNHKGLPQHPPKIEHLPTTGFTGEYEDDDESNELSLTTITTPASDADVAAGKSRDVENGVKPQEETKSKDEEQGNESTPVSATEDDDDEHNPFEWPDTNKQRICFLAVLPIVTLLYCAIPNCSNPKYKHLFGITFGLSLFWIFIFSYLLVWWATIWGAIIGLPDVVMGLTFLAAGTSIPDAVSSVVMARIGEGDMAVSSSIGSNIFDILFGLPVPWMLYTLVFSPLSTGKINTISIQSDFIAVYVILLILMVFLVIFSIMYRKWRLDKTLGAIMAGLYVVFLVSALLIEKTKPEALKTENW